MSVYRMLNAVIGIFKAYVYAVNVANRKEVRYPYLPFSMANERFEPETLPISNNTINLNNKFPSHDQVTIMKYNGLSKSELHGRFRHFTCLQDLLIQWFFILIFRRPNKANCCRYTLISIKVYCI